MRGLYTAGQRFARCGTWLLHTLAPVRMAQSNPCQIENGGHLFITIEPCYAAHGCGSTQKHPPSLTALRHDCTKR